MTLTRNHKLDNDNYVKKKKLKLSTFGVGLYVSYPPLPFKQFTKVNGMN